MKATFWKVTVAEHLIGRRAIYRDISAGEYSARYESCTLPEKPDKLYPYTWCFPSVCVEKLYNAMVLVEFPELSKSNSLTKAASTCAGAGTGSGAGCHPDLVEAAREMVTRHHEISGECDDFFEKHRSETLAKFGKVAYVEEDITKRYSYKASNIDKGMIRKLLQFPEIIKIENILLLKDAIIRSMELDLRQELHMLLGWRSEKGLLPDLFESWDGVLKRIFSCSPKSPDMLEICFAHGLKASDVMASIEWNDFYNRLDKYYRMLHEAIPRCVLAPGQTPEAYFMGRKKPKYDGPGSYIDRTVRFVDQIQKWQAAFPPVREHFSHLCLKIGQRSRTSGALPFDPTQVTPSDKENKAGKLAALVFKLRMSRSTDEGNHVALIGERSG